MLTVSNRAMWRFIQREYERNSMYTSSNSKPHGEKEPPSNAPASDSPQTLISPTRIIYSSSRVLFTRARDSSKETLTFRTR